MDLVKRPEVCRILVADGEIGYAGLEGVSDFAFWIIDVFRNVFLHKKFFFDGFRQKYLAADSDSDCRFDRYRSDDMVVGQISSAFGRCVCDSFRVILVTAEISEIFQPKFFARQLSRGLIFTVLLGIL